ncbi:MAG: hypothetical protein N2999_02255 [Proteobacteria bacterium]|nr:hypothetical protein [Pseudomonadota bacterium]
MKKIIVFVTLFFCAISAYAIKITITDPNIRPFRVFAYPYDEKNQFLNIFFSSFKSLPNFEFVEEPRSVDYTIKAEDAGNDFKITLSNEKTGEFFVYQIKKNYPSLYLTMDKIYEKITETKGVFSTKLVFSMNWYGKREIFLSDLLGKTLKKLTDNKKDSICPKMSFDRKYIVYTLYENDGATSLRLVNINDYTEKNIYSSKELNLAGGFSSDNRYVYFISYDGKQSKIFKLDVNIGKEVLLYKSRARIVSPITTFKEDELLFVSDEYGSPQIFLFNEKEKSIKRVTKSHSYATSPTVPRESGYLAYLAQVNGKNQIFLSSFDNNELVPLSYGNSSYDDIVWLENPRFLLTSRNDGKHSIVFLIDIPTQKYVKLFDIKGNISYLNGY